MVSSDILLSFLRDVLWQAQGSLKAGTPLYRLHRKIQNTGTEQRAGSKDLGAIRAVQSCGINTERSASLEEEKTIVQSQLSYLNRSDPIITSQLEIMGLTRGEALKNEGLTFLSPSFPSVKPKAQGDQVSPV